MNLSESKQTRWTYKLVKLNYVTVTDSISFKKFIKFKTYKFHYLDSINKIKNY